MRKLTRRELLKVSLGTMGALALANLPNWNKPALRVGVLPVHAQASLAGPDLRVALTWNKGNTSPGGGNGTKAENVDLDLFVWEPDGTLVYYDNMTGPTAALDVDNTWGFGPEITTVQHGMAATGRYWIGVEMGYVPCSESPVTATVQITSFMNGANQQTATFPFVIEPPCKAIIAEPNVEFPVATVDFQTGVITPWNYEELPAGFKKPMGSKKH